MKDSSRGKACTFVLLAGLPGTGKSTLARALAAELPATVLNKDEVRAALFPDGATDYSDEQNDLVMAAMLKAACYVSRQEAGPRFVLFDGRTFSSAAQIRQVVEQAEADRVEWRILWLHCPDELAIARMEASRAEHPAKDREAGLYWRVKERFEPIVAPCLKVDSGRPLRTIVQECRRYLGEAQDSSS